ncbi:hypothetical protein R50072_32240 [Simiduia litorea]|uniref:alpha/beta hydrolase family protein n=1 Tax=Simiduia litorea TaxID=1435348 RepID=UPI0036F21366
MNKLLLSICFLTLFLVACSPDRVNSAGEIEAACRVGIFESGENFLVLTRKGDGFRYMFDNGETGVVGDEKVVACIGNVVKTADFADMKARTLRITNTHFVVDDVTLAGQLIEPEGANLKTTLIVYAHGSEESGWLEQAIDPYHMVARGMSVFVYDKRGTGLSEGNYTQNFPQLAKDLVAASGEARRLAKDRFGRFGLFGLSQGGWIAPLAAEQAKADFIAVGYGLVVDILEEDAAQVEMELLQSGYGTEVISEAKKVTDLTALVATSGYTRGLEELDALREKYRNAAWFSAIKGGFSGVILNMSSEELRLNGIPMFDRLNIDWSLVPIDVLRNVKVPQLWVMAGEDQEAPIGKTIERLKTLRDEGLPIEIQVFPDTDHGMWEFNQRSDGSREYTKVTEGFYDLMADWAKNGQVNKTYGRSIEY